MKRRLLPFLLPLALAAATASADGDQPTPAPAPQPASAAAQDVIVLKNGRRLEGKIVAEDDRFVSLERGGVTRAYAKDTVASVERARRAEGASATPGTPPSVAPSDPAGADKKGEKKGNRGERRDAPLSDAAKKWLDDLIAKAAGIDEGADDVVRRSIMAAIDAFGPQAIPAVRAAQAAAPDGPQKQLLDRLAGELERRRDRRKGRVEGGPMSDDGPPGHAPEGRRVLGEVMRRLTTELGLKDEQKPKIHAILRDAFKRHDDIDRDARRDGLTAAQVAERVTAARIDTLAGMKVELTEPQYAMFEQMAERLFDMPGGPPMSPTPPAPPK